MYNPQHFSHPHPADAKELMLRHPFATLLTSGSGLCVSHIPLLLEERNEGWVLLGHVARANPHWRAMAKEECCAIFHGPGAYITPLWYERCDVPTWNYLVVHARGRARILEEEGQLEQMLERMARHFEGEDGWAFAVPEDLQGRLGEAIVGLEIPVSSWEAKFKLSQNKSAADRRGVRAGLGARRGEASLEVLDWMRRFEERVREP